MPKIIFDTTEELKPWGILPGDDSEPAANKKGPKYSGNYLAKSR